MTQRISLIAAMSKNHVIGKNGAMPWHLPADLAHFKAITLGKPIIMGRKTFESIGRPLPKRRNIVLSRQENITIDGVDIFTSLDDALLALKDEPEVVIIGGGVIFDLALSLANTMYLTYIDLDTDGDAFYPAWDETQWEVVSEEQHEADDKNPHRYRFIELERRPISPSS